MCRSAGGGRARGRGGCSGCCSADEGRARDRVGCSGCRSAGGDGRETERAAVGAAVLGRDGRETEGAAVCAAVLGGTGERQNGDQGADSVFVRACVCVCVCRFVLESGTNKLTHLFWMSPRQRDLAMDCYQVLIHDNTYKTNRFKLPCGLFSAPNR